MNETLPIESMEHELLSNPYNSFKISFSTHQPHANLEVLVDDPPIELVGVLEVLEDPPALLVDDHHHRS